MAGRNGPWRSSHLTCPQGRAISQVVSSDRSEDSSAVDKGAAQRSQALEEGIWAAAFALVGSSKRSPDSRRFKLSTLTTSSSLPRFPKLAKGGTIARRGATKT